MDRVIKFRAWNPEFKVMSENFSVQDLSECRHHGADFSGSIFLQFTGLHDKNGKEIYEGDVIGWHPSSLKNCYIIEFKFGELRFYSLDARKHNRSQPHISIGAYFKDTYIIGNIYENPELLENAQ